MIYKPKINSLYESYLRFVRLSHTHIHTHTYIYIHIYDMLHIYPYSQFKFQTYFSSMNHSQRAYECTLARLSYDHRSKQSYVYQVNLTKPKKQFILFVSSKIVYLIFECWRITDSYLQFSYSILLRRWR